MKIKVLVTIAATVTLALTVFAFYGPVVKASVDTSQPGTCPLNFPIKVSVTNLTLQKVARVHLELEAWRDGRSNNVLSNRYFTFDKTLPPFESATLCLYDKAVSVESASEGSDYFGHALRDVNESVMKTKGLKIAIMRIEPEYY